MSDTQKYSFFPEIEPNKEYMLTCGDIHNIYVEESGNPDGQPILFLHGGPGGGCGAKHGLTAEMNFGGDRHRGIEQRRSILNRKNEFLQIFKSKIEGREKIFCEVRYM